MKVLDNLRNEINVIDKELAKLFSKRMELVKEIANLKKENNLPILDSSREEQVINNNLKFVSDELKEYYLELLKKYMEVSRNYQEKLNDL